MTTGPYGPCIAIPTYPTVDESLDRLHRAGWSVGDPATCLYRDCDVIVTSWTDAHISWPRCRRTTGKGHPSLLVDAELVRAIRTEGAATVAYWWGASPHVIRRWRKVLGVGLDNPGTRRLIRHAAKKGGAAVREIAAANRKGVKPARPIGPKPRPAKLPPA